MALASKKPSVPFNAEYSVRIDWIKGHADHPGNEAADALAKEANKLARDSHWPLPLAAIPLAEVRQQIKTGTGSSGRTAGKNLTHADKLKSSFPR